MHKGPSTAKISMYLAPSQAWWTYLGIRSNPEIASNLDSRFERVIFFDEQSRPPQDNADTRKKSKYYCIFWDGITEEKQLEAMRSKMDPDVDLTALVVGDASTIVRSTSRIQRLYPDGSMRFDERDLSFDGPARKLLRMKQLKNLIMPLKNIYQSRPNAMQALRLLAGPKQVVFCGSFGTNPKSMQMFCNRHGIDIKVFDTYRYVWDGAGKTWDAYLEHMRSNAVFFSYLYDRSIVDLLFFLSMIRLLGREFFLEKIRFAGIKLYANGFRSGRFIDVYTTPFYAQHVFIDFGSVVGGGNYPRLADLKYFKKKTVEISLDGETESLLEMARARSLDTHFEREWARRVSTLRGLME